MRRPVRLCFRFLLSYILISCQGDPGPSGMSHLPGDLAPPEVSIIVPRSGTRVAERVRVEVNAFDDTGIKKLHFWINGIRADSQFTPLVPNRLYQWDLTSLSEGKLWLEVEAVDSSGIKSLSPPLLVIKVPNDSLMQRDTLSYFFTESSVIEFKLPPDSGRAVAGLGVRFTPLHPCRVRSLAVKVKRKEAWAGKTLYLDLYTWEQAENRPDSLLSRKVVILRPSLEGGDYLSWEVKSLGAGIAMEGEFFIGVILAESSQGDSITVMSDRGLWKTGHGYIYHPQGYWQTPQDVRLPPINPLIYAVVDY
ncbi:MAG: Ig-like domain-containing protein [bacterium]